MTSDKGYVATRPGTIHLTHDSIIILSILGPVTNASPGERSP